MRWLAILFLFIASPACADAVLNEKEVVACLSDNLDAPDLCFEVILAPCRHQAEIGLTRACYARLERTWSKMIAPEWVAFEERTSIRDSAWFLADQALRGEPVQFTCRDRFVQRSDRPSGAVFTAENACDLILNAWWWFSIRHQTTSLEASFDRFQADKESVEACALETYPAGELDSCIGLIRDGCLEDKHQLRWACIEWEGAIWRSLHDNYSWDG